MTFQVEIHSFSLVPACQIINRQSICHIKLSHDSTLKFLKGGGI